VSHLPAHRPARLAGAGVVRRHLLRHAGRLGATAHLPGLAGLLLSAGLAIDATCWSSSAPGGVRRAAHAATGLRPAQRLPQRLLRDRRLHITTLLAAGLLFFLATGPVRGFGITLVIGVLASLVSALLVTRVLIATSWRRWASGSARPRVSGLATLGRVREWLAVKNPELMRHRNRGWRSRASRWSGHWRGSPSAV
jgi:SecD/SecF fusion protein